MSERSRRAKAKLEARIAKQRTPELEEGVVVERPDTFAKTAVVRVGTKRVEAHYRGAAPAVGDGVHVQKKGAYWTLLATVARSVPFSGAAGGPNLLGGSANTSLINECWLWGHSYVGPDISRVGSYGWSPLVGHPDTIDDYLFGALGLDWPATKVFGQAGAQLYSFVGGIAMNYGTLRPERITLVHPYNQGVGPYLSRHGCHVNIFGTNDLTSQGDPAMEGGRALKLWKHSVQSMTAWQRLGAWFAPYLLYSAGAPEGGTPTASKYAGCTYGAGWVRTPPVGVAPSTANGGLDLFNQTFYPGAAYMQTTTTGASFTVRVPADHPGSTVWLFFAGEFGNVGAPAVSITWAGGAATLSTNDVVRNPQVCSNPITGTNLPGFAMCSVSVPLARTGAAQTITVNAGTLTAGHTLRFCGWGIEAVDPKQVTWGTIPIPKIWGGDTVGGPVGMLWPAHPDPSGHLSQGGVTPQPLDRTGPEKGDGWAAIYDAGTTEVAGRFLPAGSVVVASLANFTGITAKHLFRDRIHPNRHGNRVLADGLVTGMNLKPLTVVNLSSSDVGTELTAFVLGAVP